MKLDELDRKIINVLMRNAKLSYRDIAHAVGTSSVTVLNRVKKLEQEGVIKEYSVALDTEKVGFCFQMITDLKLRQGSLHELNRKIGSDSAVTHVFETTGEHDITLIARFSDKDEMNRFIRKIKAFDFVESVRTKVILTVLKEEAVEI